MRLVGVACAWCERVRTQDGEWQPADAGESERPETTHGICPECLAHETHAALSDGLAIPQLVDQRR